MDLNQLLIFAKVAENQSFTKSARELGMEKSTVSSKIAQLEKRLGVRLLNRTTRIVTLTEAGEGYYHYCRQIVEGAQEADRYATSLNNQPQGTLRISVPPDFGQLLIREFIKPFMLAYPKLTIDLVATVREVDLIAEHYDIALRVSANAIKHPELSCKKLFDLKLGIVASPSFLQQYGTPATLKDLVNYPFIFFNKTPINICQVAGDAETVIFENLSASLKSNDILTCREAAVAGLGISLLPLIIIKNELANHTLKLLLPTVNLAKMTLFAIYPKRKWTPSKIALFLHKFESSKQ